VGERTLSLDEMTGIQALERAPPDLPMRPGKIQRREFEYIRHGTQTLIASFDVAQGRVISASVVVSLWSIPDAPTSALMQDFYQQLQSNPDKRQAMLQTLRRYPDPKDWAAFVLIGESP
jgi:hypothetical protein